MIIDITENFSGYYLMLLDKFNKGLITGEQFSQYNTTLLLWQEKRDNYYGYKDDWSELEEEGDADEY